MSSETANFKSVIAKWLFCITLLAGLFSYSGTISQGSSSIQSTSTEQLITSATPKRTIQYLSYSITSQANFSCSNHTSLLNFDRLEDIRFQEAQQVFASIKNLKLYSLLQRNVIMDDVEFHFAIVLG